MVDKNSYCLRFFKNSLNNRNFEVLIDIMSSNLLGNLHPSCLFTIMLMTKNEKILKDYYLMVNNIYDKLI